VVTGAGGGLGQHVAGAAAARGSSVLDEGRPPRPLQGYDTRSISRIASYGAKPFMSLSK
jgi:NAD(P)-dependent dehydrogenase (short-subunit alcohol dehydrogenase family)